MYCISLFVGGPLNIAALYKFLPFWRGQLGDHPKSGSQITLLKMHLNIADLITVFIYAPSQIIWMITFQVEWYHWG
jgi:hypothetical protein